MDRKYTLIFLILSLFVFPGICPAEEDGGMPDPEGASVAMKHEGLVKLPINWDEEESDDDESKPQAPEPKMSLNNFAKSTGELKVSQPDAEDSETKITLEEDAELEQDGSASESADDSTPKKTDAPQKARVLSADVRKLMDQIQNVLDANRKRQLSTQGNTPAEILAYGFVFGADAKINHLVAPQPQPNQRGPRTLTPTPIYAIGGLCWNYPCGGKTLLRADDKNVIAKVGPGMQRKPSTLLAMMAMSSIAEKYEIRIGDFNGTVADLVKTEKAYCSDDADMSLTLIGLSFYCNCEEEWSNEFGETWSIPKMVLSEQYRPADQGTSNITDQLLGISCAVRRFENEGFELTGAMLDAKRYLTSFRDFAISAQNEQGLWHSRFFLFRGVASNSWDALYSGGHIFRFLAFELPEERLTDPKVVKSARALTEQVARTSATPTTERHWEALMTSLHALAIYKERLEATQ